MAKTATLLSLQDAKKAIQGEIEKLRQQATEKKTLLGQYRAEINALRDAPITFEDYAVYVRQNMRAVAARIPGSCDENLLGSSGGNRPMNQFGWSYFEDTVENGSPPHVWQHSIDPVSIAVGTVKPWVLLCYLGGQKFEDDVIAGLRQKFATQWDRKLAEMADACMPVEQRRIRCQELGELMKTETAALQAIQAEIDGLVSVVG